MRISDGSSDVCSSDLSGIGDEFVFGGIFREAELGRKVADGFRQGAATRNGPAKKRHPDYQRRAEELWAQDSNAYKIDVARCIAREYGVSCQDRKSTRLNSSH